MTLPPSSDQLAWIDSAGFESPENVLRTLDSMRRWDADSELLDSLFREIGRVFTNRSMAVNFPDATIQSLAGVIEASGTPADLIARLVGQVSGTDVPGSFDPRSSQAKASGAKSIAPESSCPGLHRLIRTLDGGPAISEKLLHNQDSAELIVDDGLFLRSIDHAYRELSASLADVHSASQAAILVRQWYSRQLILTAAHELTTDISPIDVGRRLSDAADAVIEASLTNATQRLGEIRGMPTRPDGSTPAVTVLATGALGARELSYASPFRLIFLFDSVDHRNVYHRQFYEALVDEVVAMLGGDPSRHDTPIDIDLRENPRHEVGAPICGFFDAIRIYETSGRLDQRLRFTKARVVAGSMPLGDSLIERMNSWVYRQYLTRADLAEAALMRRKLERLDKRPHAAGVDIVQSPGGRLDIERTIGFLQLMHGAALSSVRRVGTNDAIGALRVGGCLSIDEAAMLSESHARLCRLQNLLWIHLGQIETTLPMGPELNGLVASLGLSDESGPQVSRFDEMLSRLLRKNRDTINHLVVGFGFGDHSSAAESELVLDPDPDPELAAKTMRDHGIVDPAKAMDHLASLATETVRFLSPHRCRHFFSMIAPAVLDEVTRTPDPDGTLASLATVADSLGAKASLWELLGSNRPTMKLLVRLCAGAPYLSQILVDNPGMIDELIDSLLMNRLPSAGRLDAHSIEVCRGASDIDLILRGFKNSSHLTIGVRDILGKETLEATLASISDVAEACVRRIVDFEFTRLAEQYGDPTDASGDPVSPVVLAGGKLGCREPNYHSDIELTFLYTAEGTTKRRIGGPRSTLSNAEFFEAMAAATLRRLQAGEECQPLLPASSQLNVFESSDRLAASVDEFFGCFRSGLVTNGIAWINLCWMRAIAGPRDARLEAERSIEASIGLATWTDVFRDQIRTIRLDLESTARPENIKRGAGGTLDIEFLAATLTLSSGGRESSHGVGTTKSLAALGRAGVIEKHDSETLIAGYRTLRRVEANLRLMNTVARHDMPAEEISRRNLGYLMNEPNPEVILQSVAEARKANRRIFDKYLGRQ